MASLEGRGHGAYMRDFNGGVCSEDAVNDRPQP
jgi:hypothetical protein